MIGTLPIVSSFSLAEALELLESIDRKYITQELWSIRTHVTTLEEIGHDPYSLLCICSRIGPFYFRCGPPGKEEWKKGLISQYVADCLLQATLEYGWTFVSIKLKDLVKRGAP